MYQYYITEGGRKTGHEYDSKSEALRFAAQYSKKRKSVTVVFHKSGKFIKSFDGRK